MLNPIAMANVIAAKISHIAAPFRSRPTVALGAKAEVHEHGTSNVTPYSRIIGRVLT